MGIRAPAVLPSSSPDVVVIGGGVIGVAIGERLAREGLHVVVVEARGIGSGATGASAGMLAPLAEGVPSSAFERDLIQAFDLLLQDVERLMSSGLEVELYPPGLIHLLSEPAAEGVLRRYHRRGWPAEILPPEEVSGSFPNLRARGAVVLSLKERHLNPESLVRAYLRSLKRHGGKVWMEPALQIRPATTHVTVKTRSRTFQSRWGILAAGAWSARLLPLSLRPWVPVFPVRGQMLAYPGVQVPWIVWTPQGYALPKGRFQYVGATVERVGFRERTTLRGIRWLSRLAADLFPALRGRPWSGAWAGLRPGSPDALPIVGPLEASALVVATGHYRNGILLSAWTADRVAGWILHKQPIPARYAPARFASSPSPTPNR